MQIDLVKQRFRSLQPNLLDILGNALPVRCFGTLAKASSREGVMTIREATNLTNMVGGGATVTIIGFLAAKEFIMGVCGRVTTVIAGAGLTTISVGDGTTANRYAGGLAKALGTTFSTNDATTNPTGWQQAAANLVFTAAAGQFDSGVFEVVVFYWDLTAPTS